VKGVEREYSFVGCVRHISCCNLGSTVDAKDVEVKVLSLEWM